MVDDSSKGEVDNIVAVEVIFSVLIVNTHLMARINNRISNASSNGMVDSEAIGVAVVDSIEMLDEAEVVEDVVTAVSTGTRLNSMVIEVSNLSSNSITSRMLIFIKVMMIFKFLAMETVLVMDKAAMPTMRRCMNKMNSIFMDLAMDPREATKNSTTTSRCIIKTIITDARRLAATVLMLT